MYDERERDCLHCFDEKKTERRRSYDIAKTRDKGGKRCKQKLGRLIDAHKKRRMYEERYEER